MKTNELITVIEDQGLAPQTGLQIKEKFLPFFEQAQEWKEKAESLIVTDESQTDLMKEARTARLALKEIRIGADKTRKALKEDSLRYGKAVQGVYNVINFLIVPIEKHLEAQEKFVENKEKERKEKLGQERAMELEPLAEYIPLNLNLAEMTEEDYQKLLAGARFQQDARIKAEKEAEELRIKQEKEERERQKAIEEENRKLKAEAEKREKEMEKERAKAEAEKKKQEEKEAKEKAEYEAKLKAEREAKEKMEAELKAKAEAEAEEKRLKEEADKKAKQAPDKEKLLAFAKLLDGLELPEIEDIEMRKVLSNSKDLITKITNYIRENVK